MSTLVRKVAQGKKGLGAKPFAEACHKFVNELNDQKVLTARYLHGMKQKLATQVYRFRNEADHTEDPVAKALFATKEAFFKTQVDMYDYGFKSLCEDLKIHPAATEVRPLSKKEIEEYECKSNS